MVDGRGADEGEGAAVDTSADPAPAQPVEVELKLAVTDPEPVRAVILDGRPEDLAGFAPIAEARDVVQLDRYVDSDAALYEGRLSAAGIKARLREQDGSVVVTVKTEGVLDGTVMARTELEEPATRDLDPAAWPDSPAKELLVAALGGAPLVEVVALRQQRLTRRLRRDDTDVELSLDELEALHEGAVVARRWDVEAELKAGDRELLHELAEALLRIPGVEPPTGSKRGWAFNAVATATGRPLAIQVPPSEP